MQLSKANAGIAGIIFFAVLAANCGLKPQYLETGKASYYARSLEGKPTANGDIFSHDSLTAAHKTLPFETMLKVINVDNNKSVIVKVNDRGPFVEDRILDLSRSAFRQLAPLDEGVIEVEIYILEE